MARYDVYQIEGHKGYVLDIQTDLLNDFNTRVVVPLILLSKAPKPAKRLNPVFIIADEEYVLMTHMMATIPQALLKTPIVNLAKNFSEITNAIGMVFHGF